MTHTPLMRRVRRALRLAVEARKTGKSAAEILDLDFARREFARRHFLQGAAATALAGSALSACAGGDDDKTKKRAKVAVVGAGMAGLHCAHRLRQAGVIADVFEASDRVGGRMFSLRDFYPDDIVAELGGELIDTGHMTMHALAEEFGIELDDLAATYPDDPDFEIDTWYFDGVRVSEEQIVEQFIPLAGVMADTVAAAEADDALFEQIDNIDMVTWLAEAAPDGELIRKILAVAYTGEYGLEADEQSIFNLLYFVDYETPDPFRIFGDSDERFHTHAGNDTFISALAAAIDGQIRTGHRLVSVRDAMGGRVALTFTAGGQIVEDVYEHVVFALPFTKLREVEITATLADDKRRVIAELGYGTNAKLMSGYTSRVWRDVPAAGSSTSDLLQNTWDTSRAQAGTAGVLTMFAGGRLGWEMGQQSAEERMAAYLPAIDAMYPGAADAYIPNSAVRMHWPTAPYVNGSYACYRTGQWAFYEKEGRREGNMHFCGEHTSLDWQGFMEGAAETGALVAAEILADLGMAAPQGLVRALGPKLLIPQACFRAGRWRPMRFTERRRQIARRLARLGL